MVFLLFLGHLRYRSISTPASRVLSLRKYIFSMPKPLTNDAFLRHFFNFRKMQFFRTIAIAFLISSAPQFVTGVLVEKRRIEFSYF